jgi:guanylate kinase
MKKGTLYIISAPSGAGKTSLVNALTQNIEGIVISVSYTTRPPRVGEQHSQHYHFVDDAQFQKMIDEESFLEYATVFKHSYGTSQMLVDQLLQAGTDVILEIDWQGARQVRAHIPEAVSIFILPPSLPELRERLQNRKQDHEAVISLRVAEAQKEIQHYLEYDYLIINQNFDLALADLMTIVKANRLRLSSQRERLNAQIAGLLAPKT